RPVLVVLVTRGKHGGQATPVRLEAAARQRRQAAGVRGNEDPGRAGVAGARGGAANEGGGRGQGLLPRGGGGGQRHQNAPGRGGAGEEGQGNSSRSRLRQPAADLAQILHGIRVVRHRPAARLQYHRKLPARVNGPCLQE